ncbi:hypothetical protein BWR17_19595 (plasmid) [Phaeobacter inhibens]|nr:hypothetical protein BWR17_19595 [Phaeobacter inhibens]
MRRLLWCGRAADDGRPARPETETDPLRGKQPKLSKKQQRELCRMHATGDYSISDLAEVFSVSRPTVYRTLNRHQT